MRPYERDAVLKLNPVLVFPMTEMLLGGGPRPAPKIKLIAKKTEIEQSILDGVFRIVLQDLRMACP
jgi:flagellar motor switch protein FliM